MRRTLLAGAVVGLVAALGLAAPVQAHPLAHSPGNAVVRVFHGVPKLPVDVYVGGARVLDDFQPGTFSPSLKVPQGRYLVQVTAADAKNAKHPLLSARYSFVAHANYTVAAFLTEQGKPTLKKYRNELAGVTGGSGRITVRHDAAAPAVDVLANGAVAMSHLRNPHQSLAVLPAGTYQVQVNLAGTDTKAIGPAPADIRDQVNTIVYAWGSAADGTLAVAVQHVHLR